MALDAATQQLLAQQAAMGGKPIHEMTVTEARDMASMSTPLFGTGPEMAEVEPITIDGPGGGIPARILTPPGDLDGVILYYHGGGWVVGGLDDFDTLCRQLAARTQCAVVMVDYRLAPEHRFPAAAEDAYCALEWADAHRERLAGPGAALIVAGDSAGGNLSAVTALRARDERGPKIDLQVLVYPVTDASLAQGSYTEPENQTLLPKEAMTWFWDHYVPETASRNHPYASPLRAERFDDLPPAVVITAEHDVLRDEGAQYADRLEAAGNTVTTHEVKGQMHGFFTMVNLLPGAAVGMDLVVDAVRRSLDS